MGVFDLESQLVFYRSYHFNQTNVIIHLFCIPVIILSAMSLSVPYDIPFVDNPFINFGTLIAIVFGVVYLLLDWKLGLPIFAFFLTHSHYLKVFYLKCMDAPWGSQLYTLGGIALQVILWGSQVYGHQVYEGRAPALLDNLVQALLLAPFFEAYEVAFYFGYRPELKKSMDNKAGIIVRDFKRAKKEKANSKKTL